MAKISKKKPLGRGLSSLLGDNIDVDNLTNLNKKNNLIVVPIDHLSAGSWQVRKMFDESELHSLSQSIKNNGIFQPIVVVSDKEEKGKYKIVAGERRWRAAQLANIHEVPIILRDDLSSDKIVEISLLENLERSDLNPIEEAKGYEELINKYNYTQEKVAKIFSKSRPYITNFLRLLTLPDEIKSFIIDGKICGAISRVPKQGSILSNMSKGAKPKLTKLTSKEKNISNVIAKDLIKNNIYFAGIDFIDQKLNGDINVTSPTGLKTYFDLANIDLAKTFWKGLRA